MQIITVRQHSKKELIEKLKKKYPENQELIAPTIERLLELKYLDDDVYADALTRNRLKIKKKGLFWIKSELKMKGIKEQKIQDILENYQEEETESLGEAIRKKLSTLKNDLSIHEKKQKLAAYLQRRGYPLEKILHALNNSL
ncbi:MAG: regulatory protein RecX [Candidatus Gracilibacteria bacterium]